MLRPIHTLFVVVFLMLGLGACRSTPADSPVPAPAPERASRIDPLDDADRARRAAERGDHAAAVRGYRRAIQRGPDSSHLHADLAWSLAQLGQNLAGLEAVDEALRQSPQLAWGHYVRGWILVSLERHREAIEAYRSALRLDSTQAEVHFEYGRTLALIARHQDEHSLLPEALEHVKDALRLGRVEHKYKYYDELGNILGGMGRFDESVAALREAVRLKPDEPKLWDNLAWQAMYGGRFEEAVRAFEEAERVEPGHLARNPRQARCLEAVRAGRRCTR